MLTSTNRLEKRPQNSICLKEQLQKLQVYLAIPSRSAVTVTEYLGGVPHKVIYDNTKVAVKRGFGKYAVMQNANKVFSAHYACFNKCLINP